MVLLFIYAYYSKLLDALQINDKIKWNSVGFWSLIAEKQNIACLDETFSTPDGCVPCPNGSFSFPGWSKCVPFLNCSEIAHQVYPKQRIRSIRGGWTKEIWLADWKGHEVVHLKCRNGAGVKTRCLRGNAARALCHPSYWDVLRWATGEVWDNSLCWSLRTFI